MNAVIFLFELYGISCSFGFLSSYMYWLCMAEVSPSQVSSSNPNRILF